MRQFKSLKFFLLIRFVLAVLIPSLCIGLFSYAYLYSTITQNLHDKNELLARTLVSEMHEFFHDPMTLLELTQVYLETTGLNEQHKNDFLDRLTASNNNFEFLYFLDKNKKIKLVGVPQYLLNLKDQYIGMDLSGLDTFIENKHFHDFKWSNTFLSPVSGKKSLLLQLSIGENFLIGSLSIDHIFETLKKVAEKNIDTIFITDTNGNLIYHPEEKLVREQQNFSNITPVKNALQGNFGTHTYSINGSNFISSTALMKETGWHITVVQLEEVAYQTLTRVKQLFLTGLLFSTLIIAFLALRFAKNVLHPLQHLQGNITLVADGHYEIQLPQQEYNEIEDLALVFRSMTKEIQEREIQLQINEEKYKKIFNSPSEAIFIHGPDGIITEYNQAVLDMYGYNIDEIDKMSIGDFSAGEYPYTQQEAEKLVTMVLHRGPQVFQWHAKRKNGELFWVEVALNATEINKQQCILAVVRDITEKKSAEAEKKKMSEQLRQAQKMEAIGTLAGGIAHDFNNILTPVIGYAELVLLSLPQDSELRECQQELLNAGNRAKDLVKQILAFSRQMDHEKIPLKMQIIVKEALKLLRASLPSTIEIKRYIDDHTGSVLADPTQIHQLTMNLCTNAFHAMETTGGILGVSINRAEIAIDEVQTGRLLPPGKYITLEVSDTGSGMSKEVQERIFEPYFTTKEKGRGTGLGLSVVHGIVHSHEGFIFVYSEKERGTTFKLYLPEINAIHQEEQVSSHENQLQPFHGKEQILLVDDEKQIVMVEKKILEYLGYSVNFYTDSTLARDEFLKRPEKYDLVITDMTMPKLTGLQLADEIFVVRPDIPVILCTGFSELIDAEIAKEAGIREYITKPISNLTFAKSIRRALDS